MDKPRNSSDDIAEKFQKNMDTLFPEPDTIPTHLSIHQVQALKARVAELEASLTSQQLDNQHLSAQVEKYRVDADRAINLQIQDGWEKFLQARGELAAGYHFDQYEVKPLPSNENIRPAGFKSQPLVVGDDNIGALMIEGAGLPHQETDQILHAVADQLSGHIENLRLMEQNHKRAHELEIVSGLSVATTTILDPDVLLQSVVDLTKSSFGLYHAHIYLMDGNSPVLLLTAGAGEIGRRMVKDGWNIPLSHPTSIVANAARTRGPFIVNDVLRNKHSGFLSNQLLPNTRSEMAVPMIVGETLLGVFDVQADRPGYFSEDDAHIFITLASQVAVALQNARLYKDQASTVAQLRELDRLKSAFLANMSHELRTPLNSIIGFSDVILDGLDGPITNHMENDLRLIQKNGRHLLHLINDVLDMAKIDAGRMNLQPENFVLDELLEDVVSLTTPLAMDKSLTLTVLKNGGQPLEVYADRTRIQQVMINLVNNAIKFTEQGEINIQTVLNDHHVLIQVRDTGLGIPMDHLESIFHEFTQVDTSTTRKAGGTGLGLPISRRLVELHGGHLWVESSGVPGKGSTFFVELPLEARLTEPTERLER